jgi:hypothetical protein
MQRGVDRREDHIFEQGYVRGIDGLWVDLDGGDGAVAFGHDFDRAAAAGGFHGASGQLGLDLFHLLLHARSLFDEFSDAGHGVLEFVVYERTSTIWPLKTSSAFWISGSFLKSSLLNGAAAGAGLAGSADCRRDFGAGGRGSRGSGGLFPAAGLRL